MPPFVAVLASFRGTVQHGLPLEIGDTVQILEKCEGETHNQQKNYKSTKNELLFVLLHEKY